MEYGFGKALVIHILQGIFRDHVVCLPCAKELEKIDSAFAVCALKPCKPFIADMGAVAVLSIMAGAGIVYMDIGRDLQPR